MQSPVSVDFTLQRLALPVLELSRKLNHSAGTLLCLMPFAQHYAPEVYLYYVLLFPVALGNISLALGNTSLLSLKCVFQQAMFKNFIYSISLPTLSIMCFVVCHFGGRVVHSLKIDDIENLFLCLLVRWICSSVKNLFKFLSVFEMDRLSLLIYRSSSIF